MTKHQGNEGYTTCWTTWGLLLIMSLGMLALGASGWSRALLVPIFVAGMLLMAWLVAWRFMHLRHEKTSLVLTIVGSTLFMAVALFALIAPDGVRAFTHSPNPPANHAPTK